MIGIIANVLSVVFGGLVGAVFGNRLSEEFVRMLNLIFGLCAMCMGIASVVLMENMPAVVLAVIVGTCIGLLIHLGKGIEKCGIMLQNGITKISSKKSSNTNGAARTMNISLLVTAVVLFCSSGTGVYGCLDAGMTGNVTILMSKSILDFFTAMIFACNLGIITPIIAIPQFVIFVILYLLAGAVCPLTTPTMINDFKACGGFVLVATGLRIAGIKEFPIADMIPAMIIVMPISALWVNYIIPLL